MSNRYSCLVGRCSFPYCEQFSTVVADVKTEKQKNLEILEKLSKGKAVLDVTKAVNTVTSEAEKRYANVIMHY